MRVVFDTKLRLPLRSRLVETATEVPTWVICGPDAERQLEEALVTRGVEVLRSPRSAEGRLDATAGLRLLAQRGIVSVLVESLGLALIGGVAGGLLAYIGFNGYQTSTINFQTFSQVAFAFKVTPALLIMGLTFALMMGFIGGLLPAVRAARLPISSALREL